MIEFFLALVVLAFVCEYVDSTLGMGYGTILTPLLLIMGFQPLAIVPTILLSELLTGGFAAFAHHKAGNVNFDFKKDHASRVVKKVGRFGYMPKSRDAKIAFVLSACGLIGVIVAVFLALSIPKFFLNLFIGLIVLAMGIIILIRHKVKARFSWKKIVGLGAIAAFNKGLSGGGYGPLVTSGQILSGVKSKSSIAITSFSETFVSIAGVAIYFALGATIDWSLAPALCLGATLSVPFSVYTVKKAGMHKFTAIIGIATLLLGAFTLWKVFAG